MVIGRLLTFHLQPFDRGGLSVRADVDQNSLQLQPLPGSFGPLRYLGSEFADLDFRFQPADGIELDATDCM